MEPIETETIERQGRTYRIAIYHDAHAPNPLEDGDEMGTILSLNRRHRNFDPAAIESAIAGPDAVPLSYFEHGLCRWAVAGELPAGARCPFDSVSFAGIWLPDALTLESARPYGGWTRRQFMRKRARQACDVYTEWCNGEAYGYQLEQLCPCGGENAEIIDSCWGFFGLDVCLAEARAAVTARTESPTPLDSDG